MGENVLVASLCVERIVGTVDTLAAGTGYC